MLALIDVARWGSWLHYQRVTDGRGLEPFPYPCLLDFPGIAATDPIELLRFIQILNALMRSKVAEYEAFLDTVLPYFTKEQDPFFQHEYYKLMDDTSSVGTLAKVGHFFTGKPFMYFDREQFLHDLTQQISFGSRWNEFVFAPFVFDIAKHREDVRVLQHAMTENWQEFARKFPPAASRWTSCDELARTYLIARACDLVMLNDPIADLTFPKPLFSGANELVAALTRFLQETQQRIDEENVRREVENRRPGYERKAAEKAALITIDLPAHLPATVLSDAEREWLTAVCLEDLRAPDLSAARWRLKTHVVRHDLRR